MYNYSLKDEQLISSYIKGNKNCLNILVNRHRSRIIGFIISKVRDKSLSEDIFQETFVRVMQTFKN